jgi:hypothetical protein
MPPGGAEVTWNISLENWPHRRAKASAVPASSAFLARPAWSFAPSARWPTGSSSAFRRIGGAPSSERNFALHSRGSGADGATPQFSSTCRYPSLAVSSLTASRMPGLMGCAGIVQPRPTESAVISDVCQILKSAGPSGSRSGPKHAREIPGADATPRNSKIPTAMVSGSATRSS